MTSGLRFRHRLPGIVVTAFAAFLVAFALVTTFSEHAYRNQKFREVQAQARILASTVTAALNSSDREAAQEYVDTFSSNLEIEEAALYDSQGMLFVNYQRAGDLPPPSLIEGKGSETDANHVAIVLAVREGNMVIGSVYIRSVVRLVWSRVARYAVFSLLIATAILVVGVLAAGRAALSDVNAELGLRAAELANANRDLQAEIAEREKVEAALRQVQKMEAIGQLTGGLAHDFNNLLQVVLGNLDTLRRRHGNGLNNDARRLVDAAMTGAERGGTLARQLLAIGRRQPLDPKSIDANRLVAQTSEMLHRTLGTQISVVTRLSPDLWYAFADANQLESAVLNLAVNARDAMPNGGTVMIATSNEQVDDGEPDTARDLNSGEYVTIQVSDTGVGMTPDIVAKVFEPFYTTKSVGKGSGLGLSQVYGYAKQSGGHVRIASIPNEGTTVTIFLPRGQTPETVMDTGTDAQAIASTSVNKTILVVDDEALVLLAASESLQEMGYRVLTADRAASALKILEGDDVIDVLFSDVVMPGTLNGVELAAEAARMRPEIKILLASGYPRTALSSQHGLAPDVSLLQKPYRATELGKRISELCV